MSDMESIETPNGELNKPTQASSKGTTDNTSAVDLDALTKTLESIVEKAVERKWQTGKDVRFAKVEKHEQKMTEFERQLARLQELTSQGISEKDALWRMKVESRLGENAPVSSTEEAGNQTEVIGANKVELDAVIKLAGYDPGDKIIADVIAKHPNDVFSIIREVTNLGLKRREGEHIDANPAQLQSVGTGGKVPVSEMSEEDLNKKLEELMKYPSKNAKQIKELTKELDKYIKK